MKNKIIKYSNLLWLAVIAFALFPLTTEAHCRGSELCIQSTKRPPNRWGYQAAHRRL
ncbi:putative membrane protein [Chitinophagaceae bacterium OAS944]|nr:putative membrane protein [Chitinophagaceae bacterium OAS944]